MQLTLTYLFLVAFFDHFDLPFQIAVGLVHECIYNANILEHTQPFSCAHMVTDDHHEMMLYFSLNVSLQFKFYLIKMEKSLANITHSIDSTLPYSFATPTSFRKCVWVRLKCEYHLIFLCIRRVWNTDDYRELRWSLVSAASLLSWAHVCPRVCAKIYWKWKCTRMVKTCAWNSSCRKMIHPMCTTLSPTNISFLSEPPELNRS